MMTRLLSLGFVLFMVGCDSLNSSFDQNMTQNNPNPQNPGVQKPKTCQFDFSKTCWADSVAEITSCLEEPSSEEVFNHTKEFCSDTHQKLIAFANPLAMFTNPFDVNSTPIDFRVFPDSVNECLRITGTAQKFKVISGKKVIEYDFTSDRMKFKCLDGQIVQVPYEVFEGCAESLGEKFVSTVPGLQFDFSQKNNRAQWTFRLRGAPSIPDIFRCVEP